MDKILSKDTIKNVFSALGAKTSDSNYGVALLDKTSGEPKGFMGMSDLASVLGVNFFGRLTASQSPTLKDAPLGVWFVYDTATFSDNPYPNNASHCSILISTGITNNANRGAILIDVESASTLIGIYVTYSNQERGWKKLV